MRIAYVCMACCLLLSVGARAAAPETKIKVFTIGGAVKGLTGSGLTLANNQRTDVSIAADGTFTFPIFVTNGAKYDVSVVHQPSSPTQVCTVINGTGAVNNAAVTNIAVSCQGQRHWHVAVEIGQGTGFSRDARAATDSNGNALAVWTLQPDPSAGATGVFSNRFTAAGGWAAPSPVGVLDSAFRPKLAVDAAGNALAVWHSFDGNLFNVMWSGFTPNAGWSPQALIQNPTASKQLEPQIAIDRQGNAVAVWQQFDGSRFRIVSSRYLAGSGWTALQAADSGAGDSHAGDAFQPQVALDSQGNALIVWQQFDPVADQVNLWANRFSVAANAWGTALELGQAESLIDPDRTPRIVFDTNDNALAVWNQPLAGVWADRYLAGSGWQVPQVIGSGSGTDHPDVDFDAHGNARAVWEQAVGGQRFIWTNALTASAGWGKPAQIETHTGGDATRPRVAVDASGNTLAAWQQRDDARNSSDIWAARFAGSGWSAPERISNDAGAAAGTALAKDTQGNVLAVWEQFDAGDNVSVWSNRFDDAQ
jgi:hypothetical protein